MINYIGKKLTKNEFTSELVTWINEQGYYLKDIKEGDYVYEIVKPEELSEEIVKDNMRHDRRVLLDAFDKWEKGVLRGREEEGDTVMGWYRDLLDLDPKAFADVPEKVRYYL